MDEQVQRAVREHLDRLIAGQQGCSGSKETERSHHDSEEQQRQTLPPAIRDWLQLPPVEQKILTDLVALFLKHSRTGMSADADKSVPNSPKSIDEGRKTADNRDALETSLTEEWVPLIREAEARGRTEDALLAVRMAIEDGSNAGAQTTGDNSLPGSDASTSGGTGGSRPKKAAAGKAADKRDNKGRKASG